MCLYFCASSSLSLFQGLCLICLCVCGGEEIPPKKNQRSEASKTEQAMYELRKSGLGSPRSVFKQQDLPLANSPDRSLPFVPLQKYFLRFSPCMKSYLRSSFRMLHLQRFVELTFCSVLISCCVGFTVNTSS